MIGNQGKKEITPSFLIPSLIKVPIGFDSYTPRADMRILPTPFFERWDLPFNFVKIFKINQNVKKQTFVF